jgi:hypothetical protein
VRNEEEKGRRREKKGERESTEKMAHTCMDWSCLKNLVRVK